MNHTLSINEIYLSIQGESSYSGRPCWFIRLKGCPLRCKWCDTAYAFEKGDDASFDEIIEKINSKPVNLVEVTGGEPLAQENTPALIMKLHELGKKVLIETSGSFDVSAVTPYCHIIMDLKCPDSKMSHHNLYSNLDHLKPTDEIKFVVASYEDFLWAHNKIKEYDLTNRFKLLISPAWGLVKEEDLVDWIIRNDVPARLNLQLHKYIWSPRKRGV